MKDTSEIIRDAARRARQETDVEPAPQVSGDIKWPVTVELNRGLEGAIACTTKIGYVNGAKGWLVYRGYNCFDLAEKSSFEETTFLLIHGRLPSRSELDAFKARLGAERRVPGEVAEILARLPIRRTHPMAALRTAVSVLGTLDESADITTTAGETEISVKLIAQLATLTGMIGRMRAGAAPLEPDPSLSHAADFLRMLTGRKPDALSERLMDIALILHADHGMNASTFTSMVTNSSLSDMYSTVVAGIASLKGPLHGGANEQVLYMLDEIGSPENVEPWFRTARGEGRKIMGIGHRVYKALDPRARILGPLAALMAEIRPELRQTYETAKKLEEIVGATISQDKKLFPNVDFWSGIVYRGMDIEPAMFTPIFAVSRVAGWTARVLEYHADNRIFRPRAAYQGPLTAEYLPLERRSA